MKQLQIAQFILCAMGFLAVPAWGIDITEELPEGEDLVDRIKKEEPSAEEYTLTRMGS
jgi:hypothetical protein